MRELALHLLDIAENSITAKARDVMIRISENTLTDRLIMIVEDNGKGMDASQISQVTDPFFTSRTTRKVGLGIPLLKSAAEACSGGLSIRSTPGIGTQVSVEFQRSHIDRMPLGNIPETLLHLLVGNPGIHWTFEYQVDGRSFLFDDFLIKKELDGIPLSEPVVIGFLRKTLEDGFTEIQPPEIRLGLEVEIMKLAQ